MRNYTMEVVASPVIENDFSVLARVLDDIHGSALIEDPDQPTLILDVDADSRNKAQMFVLGMAQVLGFEIQDIHILDEQVSDSVSRIPNLEIVEDWVQSAPHNRLAAC